MSNVKVSLLYSGKMMTKTPNLLWVVMIHLCMSLQHVIDAHIFTVTHITGSLDSFKFITKKMLIMSCISAQEVSAVISLSYLYQDMRFRLLPCKCVIRVLVATSMGDLESGRIRELRQHQEDTQKKAFTKWVNKYLVS